MHERTHNFNEDIEDTKQFGAYVSEPSPHFTHRIVATQSFEDLFRRALGTNILTPSQAAALTTCIAHSRLECELFSKQADDLLQDAKIFPFSSRIEKLVTQENLGSLEDIL